ncbi:hypothetical protein [Kordiimonas marina]|uniref:hypothetical protein n=1 Tax=Kordiimonas marina TaxID=2872312 RepID=UPI001FF49980|nr:hypothetical protein [Kordiimonas marina]MCJ9430141.1 hypothetical protein [Kordiimonas marina]
MPNKMDNLIFSEVQRFSEWFFIGVVVFILLINAYVLSQTPAEAQKTIFFSGFAIIAILIASFYYLTVRTEVDGTGVRVSLSGMGKKFVPFEDIEAASRYEYRPLRQFGGWGIRLGAGGIMYNARGTVAVKLELKSGKPLYIGTQRVDDLLAAITPHIAGADA